MTLELSATVAARDLEVSLEVADGETLALLGPNGTGKSTVLAVAAGLLRPDDGRVVLDGEELTGRRVVPPHARRTALLAQDPLLFPHLTALDNVAFGPRSAGVRRRAARDRARGWLAEVGADDLAGRRPGRLSGGQAQRVAIARALAAEPRLLLLDEPMAALDVAVTPALRQTLKRVLEGRTTVVVTHDVLDALLLADRVVVLDRGRVVEQGPTAEVLARPRSAFAARVAGLNMVAGRWSDGVVRDPGGRSVAGTPSGPALREGDAAVAVFRPRAVSVFRQAPGGSPRTALEVVVTDLEPHGDQVRVRAGDLAADVTAHAAAELDLAPGAPVTFVVKATEVDVYPR
ncbi:sulfate/molybdate ABC transporter ATP-binding protein [Nocardioides marmotae]|uniref:sulfate/molybdate ABC transporter ATP-binding protein n=1 Tax=Nocardioides marmotae TaxID=2663857 RepID=UPI0013269170|nr:ABC transporter ATP-binding protein [Nocardioides marmotae]MBC9734936.1 ABC transporter ATP-binding protein [Nocardioides marmotae]MTB86035.1 ATP-binding cassette domain-containing protein [Nocardioides marmotae]QKE00476.1 ABC transporter ATP-binding protein [Nocardioides marmotae]